MSTQPCHSYEYLFEFDKVDISIHKHGISIHGSQENKKKKKQRLFKAAPFLSIMSSKLDMGSQQTQAYWHSLCNFKVSYLWKNVHSVLVNRLDKAFPQTNVLFVLFFWYLV